ncbi:MAG: RNA polymerase sigma factor [Lachnospiraceae bacterium]|nr:RNA polymerase sigma factor [Lachnospiraceae bacterium]
MLLFAVTAPPARTDRQADILESYIQSIAQSDKESLALLYEKTHAAIYGFALSILKNTQDAEDVVHDTYIQIWKAAKNYKPAGKPLAWIFTITRNLARMRIREQSRTISLTPEDWQSIFADNPVMDHEDRMIMELLLGILSDEERQIVILHAVTGMKHREIAALLHLGLSTVLSKYNRAIKKLRKALKEAS